METISQEEFKARYGERALSRFNGVSNTKPGMFAGTQDRLAEVGQSTADTIKANIEGAGEFADQSSLRRGAQATAAGFTSVPKGAYAMAPEPVRKALDTVIGWVGKGFNKATDALSETDTIKGAAGHMEGDRYVKHDLGTTEEALGIAAATGEIAGTVAGAEGAVKTVSGAAKAAGTATKTSYEAIARASSEVGKLGSGAVGKAKAIDLGLSPENIMQRVARVSKGKQAKFEQRAGESIGQYLVNRDVFGTPDEIVDQLYTRMKESKGRVDQSIATVKGDFKAPQIKTALDDLIERDTRVSTTGAASPDSKRITELYKKYNQQGLSLSEVNEVKRLYERNVRVDYLSVGAPSDKLVRATNVDSALRKLVEDKAMKSGVNVVKELNKETSLAKQLLDDLGAEYAGSLGNNAIGLTDAIFLAEAFGNPIAAAGFIAKKTLSSKSVMSKIAEKTSKNAGSKADLPEAAVNDSTKLTGYMKFLENQANRNSQ